MSLQNLFVGFSFLLCISYEAKEVLPFDEYLSHLQKILFRQSKRIHFMCHITRIKSYNLFCKVSVKNGLPYIIGTFERLFSDKQSCPCIQFGLVRGLF